MQNMYNKLDILSEIEQHESLRNQLVLYGKNIWACLERIELFQTTNQSLGKKQQDEMIEKIQEDLNNQAALDDEEELLVFQTVKLVKRPSKTPEARKLKKFIESAS